MNTFRLSYPVTLESVAALARFTEIAKAIQIPGAGRSELEVVRLLGNTHYEHADRLLSFIEHELSGSGLLGARAVKQRDPFQFRESLAELFLFSHLRRRLGSSVQPAGGLASEKGPEIEIAWRDLVIKVEVYSPIDLLGFQLLTEHLPPLFKYLDVSRGFVVEISVDPVDESVGSVWYPYTLPARQEVLAWLEGVGQKAEAFLARSAVLPGDRLRLPGPGGTTGLLVEVREVFDDPEVREVIFTAGTRSTDARLLFECGTPEDTARSGWGRKLKDKMRHRQAGPPTPGVLRVLVVNFAQADTGWPDFFGWSDIAQRLEDTVRLIVGELSASLPYDLVLPARLDLECCFGQPVWLNSSLEEQGTAFLEAAGLEHSCFRSRAQTQSIDPVELVELAPSNDAEEATERAAARRDADP